MHMKGENIIIVFKIKGFSLPHSKQKTFTSIHESKLFKILGSSWTQATEAFGFTMTQRLRISKSYESKNNLDLNYKSRCYVSHTSIYYPST